MRFYFVKDTSIPQASSLSANAHTLWSLEHSMHPGMPVQWPERDLERSVKGPDAWSKSRGPEPASQTYTTDVSETN